MSDLIYLVRHGEVDNPKGLVYADLDGFGLSQRGRAQAAATAERLPPDSAIVSSPLDRAMQTAQILVSAAGTSVTIDADLTEWRLMNRWAGHRWGSIDQDFPGELTAYLEHPDRLPFSEESLHSLADRMVASVLRHRAATTRPLVFVSHQDPIRAAALSLTDRSPAGLHLYKLDHGSIVTLVQDGGGAWRPAT